MLYMRFLIYSLRTNRPVRVLLTGDKMKYVNLTVLEINDESFIGMKAGRKTPVTVPFNQILAVSYARGDNGDTSKEFFKT